MQFNNSFVNCNASFSSDYKKVTIVGNVINPNIYSKMLIIAANPIDRMSNYSGSGLPFPCSDIAFENTPNKSTIDKSGSFNATFSYPNSFYDQNGYTKLVSSVYFILTTETNKEVVRFELKDLCVLRTLADRSAKQKGPEFYAAKDYLLPIDSAENVMRAYSKAKIEHDIA